MDNPQPDSDPDSLTFPLGPVSPGLLVGALLGAFAVTFAGAALLEPLIVWFNFSDWMLAPALNQLLNLLVTAMPAVFLYLVILPQVPHLNSGMQIPSRSKDWYRILSFSLLGIGLVLLADFVTSGFGTSTNSALAVPYGGMEGQVEELRQYQQGQGGAPLPAHYASFFGLNELVLCAILVLGSPLIEEYICRGVFLPLFHGFFDGRLTSFGAYARPFNCLFSVVLSALLFALPHAEAVFSQFLFGLIVGWLYLRSGNIWSSVLVHVMNNALVAVVYFA
ncbi:MAG TPA: CPBP family intramembrane metalloprotease [Candidatus Obscuribacter sp.]|nr:CPBP family intramembrane metalloprotease [Candidatus Obscuribacter sp.]